MTAFGILKAVIKTKGYGFIEPLPSGDEIYFHASIVEGGRDVFATLNPLDYVEFEPDKGPKGMRALFVKLVTDKDKIEDLKLWRNQISYGMKASGTSSKKTGFPTPKKQS